MLAFEIDGVMSSEEIPRVIQQLEDYLTEHHEVRFFNRMKHFGPSIFMQTSLVSMQLSAMQKVERYAIVGAPGWMRKVIDVMSPAFPDIDMRTFPADREVDAWHGSRRS